MFPSFNYKHLIGRRLFRARNPDEIDELKNIVIPIVVILVILFLFFILSLSGNYNNPGKGLVINEIMASNQSVIADEDGEYWDWIEITNKGASPVKMENWGLSDDTLEPFKWKFPQVTIKPGQYLLVFASGKDRNNPSAPYLHTNFKLSSKGEEILLSNNNGQPVSGVKAPSLSSGLSYGMAPEDKEAWLCFKSPTPGYTNSTEGYVYPEQKADIEKIVCINEYMLSNKSTITDEDGEFSDWIEIVNFSNSPVNLKGYGLSDDKNKLFKWEFPDISINAGQYLLVFASGKDHKELKGGHLHTNFKLSSEGETLELCNNVGQIVDTVQVKHSDSNISCGRQIEDINKWLYFTQATPGSKNDTEGFPSLSPQISLGSGLIKLSEAMTVNTSTIADEDGQYSNWIEITNGRDSPVNIKDYGLSDDENSPSKWKFPDITLKPDQYMVIFASGKDRYNPGKGTVHTNFKLNSSGELIVLSDSSGKIIDELNCGKLYAGISCGRLPDGKTERVIFKTPTPSSPNNVPTYGGVTSEPEFSNKGGFYIEPIHITLKGEASTIIRYTMDGSEPTAQSQVYSSPILIDKTTVVRARSFGNGLLPSLVSTNTFFINKKHTLTVISLSTNPKNLWDPDNGICSMGKNASDIFPYQGANFWMDIEKPVHFELFEPDGKKGLSFNGGIKIFGAYSRAMDQKSFSIYARDSYGCDEINYPFFSEKPITSFKSIILRTSGQDATMTKIRDAMMHRLIKDTEVDRQAYRPAVLYLNGEYWGVYNIREKISRFYLASNHGVDPDNVDILEANGRVKAGSSDDYKALVSFVSSNDMSLPKNYDYVKEKIDIQNFMDYQIAEIYFANTDTGNIKFWRDRSPGGKWKWILFDTDWGFFNVNHNTLWYVTNSKGTGIGQMFSTAIMYNLLKNDSFKNDFINRLAYHLNNTFKTERVISVIDEMAKTIEPEMPGQLSRWGGSINGWNNYVQSLRNFAMKRPSILLSFIKEQFNLSSEEIKLFNIEQ